MLGFNELVGVRLEKADYVSRILTNTFRQCGYSQISMPIVELESSFSEEVIGKSPWPEWNKKGCFYFDIEDYSNSYNDLPIVHHVLLVPEGTISITRWLGESLNRQEINLPIKVFYYLKCFRNELTSTLSKTKGREFTQFGMEIMGSDNIMVEAETIKLIVYSLEQLGINAEMVTIRFNDISIFNQLITESGLEERRIAIKELLDTLAEIKAGKKSKRLAITLQELKMELQDISESSMRKWRAIINQDDYQVDEAKAVFGKEYSSKFEKLMEIQSAFKTLGINVDLDLCVIRSHEYYTSMSFEVDVCGTHEKFVEIAGGGRYDRLVSSFISSSKAPAVVPCVGFAFGVERVIELLDQESLYLSKTIVSSKFDFTNGNEVQDKELIGFLDSIRERLS